MTLVFDQTSRSAQTHALIVGAGAYPHLIEGSKSLPEPAPDSYGLKQLSSPSASAVKITCWLVRDFKNQSTPLGSVDLLISKDNGAEYNMPGTGLVPVENPTKNVLTERIVEWKRRCDANPENIALFYFCGHGLACANELSLLASDFGDPGKNKFENAIDFQALVGGMEWSQAVRQFFFIDACRTEPEALLHYKKFGDDGILEQHNRPPLGRIRKQAVFFAAGRDQGAHGRLGKPSRFTDALLRGLNGAGAHNPSRRGWVVNTYVLGQSIAAALELGNRRREVPQQEFTAGKMANIDLHWPDFPFNVPVAVACQPSSVMGSCDLVVTPPAGVRPIGPFEAQTDIWLIDLEANDEPYKLELRFDATVSNRMAEQLVVGPTHCDFTIEVSDERIVATPQ